MVNSGVETNVEAVLMNAKIFRRRPGDVPYPVEHTGDSSAAFDIWDHMVMKTCCQNLTVHQFDTPPAVVLDLGCGSGYWAIEAAKEWNSSTIVGYDVRDIQPNLFAKGMEPHKEIAHRVKWVHGNLLDGLQFSASHFDYVRIVNIGLGVPEDEWQFVFEEVARIMKPGGVIEVIEEDPIFPCALPPQRAPRTRPRPSPISIDLPPLEFALSSALSSKSSTTIMSDPWSATFEEHFERFDLNSPRSTLTVNSMTPPLTSPQSAYIDNHPYLSYTPRAPSMSEFDRTQDPRDHSRLKAAWEAMLSSRFIASNLLSVLPFYFSSSFADVQIHPPLKVPLPPNSSMEPAASAPSSAESSLDWTTLRESKMYSATSGASSASIRRSRPDSSTTPSDESVCPHSTTWTNMHLASVVNRVTGCKEAIWHEYKALYAADDMPLVTRTTRPGEVVAMSARSNSSTRESFDDEWTSWQNDMTDRIGMRASLAPQFGWPEPPGERPNWRVWRSMLAKVQLHEERQSVDTLPSTSTSKTDNPELCRSMRCYVGCKPRQ
ncbi:hypothetical protein FPV67DRAFT_1577947 [Lyophyllum atratum]|nr:hypothetical protein FPV67DRAFT_1577947 [Lyophyllum atratum]